MGDAKALLSELEYKLWTEGAVPGAYAGVGVSLAADVQLPARCHLRLHRHQEGDRRLVTTISTRIHRTTSK